MEGLSHSQASAPSHCNKPHHHCHLLEALKLLQPQKNTRSRLASKKFPLLWFPQFPSTVPGTRISLQITLSSSHLHQKLKDQ